MIHKRDGFSMLELVFVIVIIGVLSKFGVEFLAQAYRNFIFSNINHKLQSQSEAAVEFIAKRLEYRIKSSLIAREGLAGAATSIRDASVTGQSWTVLEWVGEDVDSFRGATTPYWSGLLDLDSATTNAINLPSPGSVLANVVTNITNLGSNGGIGDVAIHFIDGVQDPLAFGWDAFPNIANRALRSIHPVGSNVNSFTGNFANVEVFEHYKLAWTAYGIVHNANDELELCYDYQPWRTGDRATINNAKCETIMENVSSFQFRAIDNLLKIQVCVHSDGVISGDRKDDQVTASGEYAICKEKTVF